jgi:hypothetical protein
MEENSSNASIIQPSIFLQSVLTEHQAILPPASTGTSKNRMISSRLCIDRWKRSSSKLVPKYNKLSDLKVFHVIIIVESFKNAC